jgi:hypothetical protein
MRCLGLAEKVERLGRSAGTGRSPENEDGQVYDQCVLENRIQAADRFDRIRASSSAVDTNAYRRETNALPRM